MTGELTLAVADLRKRATSPALVSAYRATLRRWTPVTRDDVYALLSEAAALHDDGRCSAAELNAIRRLASTL